MKRRPHKTAIRQNELSLAAALGARVRGAVSRLAHIWLLLFALAVLPPGSSFTNAFAQQNAARKNQVGQSRGANTQSLSPEALVVLQPKIRTWLDSLEERARRVVGEQISEGLFLLYLSAEVSESKLKSLVQNQQDTTKLTTLPLDISNAEKQKIVADTMKIEEIPLVMGPMTLTLTFDKEVSNSQIKALTKLIVKAVNLNTKAGDKVKLSKAPLLASSTRSRLEKLSTKVDEGSKDVERLRYESTIAQQKISQAETSYRQAQEQLLEAENRIALLERQLSEEKSKAENLEEEVSIYKTPLGEIKRLIKGLELPLTVLPVAVMLFLVLFVLFFLYLRLQGGRTNKLMQAADAISAALVKAGKSGGSGDGGARPEFLKQIEAQNEEASRSSATGAPQALIAEELVAARSEAINAWKDLKKHPYLTSAELREWLVGGGSLTQRFIALAGAIGPVESMAVLQQFSPEDLAFVRSESTEAASKIQGYTAILSLYRAVKAEVIRRPGAISTLDFPELVATSDDRLIATLVEAEPLMVALTLNLLPPARKSKILDELPAGAQGRAVDGSAALESLGVANLPEALVQLRNTLGPKIDTRKDQKLGAAEDLALLLKVASPKTKANLQAALGKHAELSQQVTAKMVTFDDVLGLELDIIAELLDDLEPEEIASLMAGLAPGAQQRLGRVLSQKVGITVQTELQRIGQRQSLLRRAQSQSLALQNQLINKVKDLMDEGVVELNRLGGGQSPRRTG